MPVVFAVIGLVLGAMTGSFAGALAVAALGYAIGLHITFKQRIDELEHGIELVRLARERRDAGDPEPAPAGRVCAAVATPSWVGVAGLMVSPWVGLGSRPALAAVTVGVPRTVSR